MMISPDRLAGACIASVASAHRLPFHACTPRRPSRSPLSADFRAAVIAAHRERATYRALAAEFGIGKTTVFKIVRGVA